MAEGDENALKEVREAIKTEMKNAVQEGTKEANNLNKAIELIDGINFDINGTANFDSIFE
jgi:hypothetical protein